VNPIHGATSWGVNKGEKKYASPRFKTRVGTSNAGERNHQRGRKLFVNQRKLVNPIDRKKTNEVFH